MTTFGDYRDLEEYQNRSRKLSQLRELGLSCYPHSFKPEHSAEHLLNQFDEDPVGSSDDAGSGSTQETTVAGRIVLFRAMGKNAFAHVQDGTGRIQVMFNRDETKVTDYHNPHPTIEDAPTHLKLLEKMFDLGDIVGIKGHLFRTQKGELTIFAKEVTMLCKTLLPLAEKHAGLHDKELRYRKRWLDLISNQDVRENFRRRSHIIKLIRNQMEQLDFTEVETPVLQSIYGGAEARPFVTELHALHQEMFLRIALEIPLKKLIVGGMDRVFEIGRVFRNEGIDRNHNPEFTMFEAYAAYWDYNDMMCFMENLCEKIAIELHGKSSFKVNHPVTGEEIELDMKAPWKRMSMKESLKVYANRDVEKMSEDEIRKILLDSGEFEERKLKSLPRGLLIASLFELEVEEKLIQPHHITDHPIETTPLCKLHRNPKEKADGIVERFESFVLCQEISNAYTELNDPVLQRELLEEQQQKLASGNEEANPYDEEFVESICQGMPPTGGIGIGIDRLVMLFTNSASIRDVLFFPWMKPLNS